MKKVAIVILHYNGKKDTLECLESISKLSFKNIEPLIIVVDNGSAEEFKAEGIKVIRSEKNLGFAGGNNIGINYALGKESDYILVLNNDTIVEENLINELLNVISENKNAGVVVPKIYFTKGQEFHKNRYKEKELGKVIWYAGGIFDWKNIIGYHKGVDDVDTGQYGKIEETEFATGCCFMAKREVFEKAGLLDEKYYLYYEDADLSQRVKKEGYKILFVPKAIVWHNNAGSAGGSGSSLQDYYITRNRILFGLRYAPFRSKLPLIYESFRLLINGRKWQKRGVLDLYLQRFGKGSYKSSL